ncbi:unnamed protein product [Peniophora sp. CBMAI 1063]|nr:unnamed protein product [Peniophora sp. CBMAI 1063]
MAPHVNLAAYYKLEGGVNTLPTPPMTMSSYDDPTRSPRNSIERKRGVFRLSALSSIERSVWEDSPRSSLQSFTVARPNRRSGEPISWLPPELLCAIFELVAVVDPPLAPGGALGQIGTLGWISLGHVCRYWRDVLLNLPSLWAGSVGVLARAAETMLERATDAPITLSLDDSSNDCSFHARHIARAQTININVSSSSILYDMRVALGAQDLPALETLSMIHAFGHIPPHNFDLPPFIAPRLKRVHMENYFVPWTAASLSHLTLVRTRPLREGEARPTLQEVLDLLRNSNTLRHLTIHNWVPELIRSTSAVDEPARVTLPFLERLEIRDRTGPLVALWKSLHVSSHTRVQLCADLLGMPPEGIAGVPNAIFRVLGPHYRSPHAPPLTHVSFSDCRGDSFLRVRASAAGDAPESPRLSVDLWPWRPQSAVDFQNALAAFSLHLALADVETLLLDCPAADHDGDDIDGHGWREPLAPMRHLRTLEVHDSPPASLLRALGPERDAHGELLFPNLRALALRPCAHRRRDEARTLPWMCLYNSLRVRAARSTALRRLELNGYFRLDPPARTRLFQDELDKVVVEVEWEL